MTESGCIGGSTRKGRNLRDTVKPFSISKREVWEAYKRVKANQGAAGVDGQSIAEFEGDLQNNLYKRWNRMASGSYVPPPVRRVDIPKGDGRTRPLGIPTMCAQCTSFNERSGSQDRPCGGRRGEYVGVAPRAPQESRCATTVRQASLGPPG